MQLYEVEKTENEECVARIWVKAKSPKAAIELVTFDSDWPYTHDTPEFASQTHPEAVGQRGESNYYTADPYPPAEDLPTKEHMDSEGDFF